MIEKNKEYLVSEYLTRAKLADKKINSWEAHVDKGTKNYYTKVRKEAIDKVRELIDKE